MAEERDDERSERGARILDAAAELLLRHGYSRVTIEDVARRAGIGKGTVYLHWRTREELFTAVLIREVARAFGEIADVLETDPGAWQLHRASRAFFMAIMARPLLVALIRSDPEVLGRLSGKALTEHYDRRVAFLDSYFRQLAGHGLLRDDLSIEDLGLAYRAIFEGFFVIDVIEHARDGGRDRRSISTEHAADVLAATLRAACESGVEVPGEVQESLRRGFAELLRAVAAADLAGLRTGVVAAPSSPLG